MKGWICVTREEQQWFVRTSAIQVVGTPRSGLGRGYVNVLGPDDGNLIPCDQTQAEIMDLIAEAEREVAPDSIAAKSGGTGNTDGNAYARPPYVSTTASTPAPSAWGPLERLREYGDPTRYVLARYVNNPNNVTSGKLSEMCGQSWMEYAEIPQ